MVNVIGDIGLVISGDAEAKVMTLQRPMKMAAAEALYHTSKPASFSLFTIGSLNGNHDVFSLRIPHTAGLDPATEASIARVLDAIAADRSIVITSHHPAQLRSDQDVLVR